MVKMATRVLAHGGVPREVQQQRRLADAGPRRADHEVGAVEATEQRVEVHEAGAHRADRAGERRVDARRLPELLQQRPQRHQVAHALRLPQRHQQVLGARDRAFEVRAALVRELHDLRAGSDHLAVRRVALHDVRVVLDADRRRQLADDAREIRDAAGVVQLLAPRQFVRQRHLVDRLVPRPQRQARLVRPAVLVAIEVLRLHDPLDAPDRLFVDQDRRDAGLFGLDIERRQLVGGHHRYASDRSSCFERSSAAERPSRRRPSVRCPSAPMYRFHALRMSSAVCAVRSAFSASRMVSA